jgi:transposase
MREALLRSRTKLINVTKGYLRTIGERAPMRHAGRMIAHLRDKLPQAAQPLEPVLQVIEALNQSLKQLDGELEALAASNRLAQRLQTAPGVGVVTSLRYLATLDDASRFRNGAAVGSYVGLVPSEHSSGQARRKGGITMGGSAPLRAVAVQAGWAALRSRRHRNDPMLCWARAIARRRGRRIAVVALARKLMGILFAMWRDGAAYDATRAALSLAPRAFRLAPTGL